MGLGMGRGAKPARQCEFIQDLKEMDGKAISTALQLITADRWSRIQKYHCGIHLTASETGTN